MAPKKEQQETTLLSADARLVEVILFLENEPVSFEKLLRMTSLTEEPLQSALAEAKEHYGRTRPIFP